MCLYIICLSSQSNEHGRTPRFPPHVLPIHAGSTGNATHDILDVSPVNLIVIAIALKYYLIAVLIPS